MPNENLREAIEVLAKYVEDVAKYAHGIGGMRDLKIDEKIKAILSKPENKCCEKCQSDKCQIISDEPHEPQYCGNPNCPCHKKEERINYVDSRTPEERANEPKSFVTTTSAHPLEEGWEEEFDKKFLEERTPIKNTQGEYTCKVLSAKRNIKSFISNLLASQRERIETDAEEFMMEAVAQERKKYGARIENLIDRGIELHKEGMADGRAKVLEECCNTCKNKLSYKDGSQTKSRSQ